MANAIWSFLKKEKKKEKTTIIDCFNELLVFARSNPRKGEIVS